jgi:hypothetical protein
MRKSLYVLAAILSLGAVSAFAEEVTCESIDDSREECVITAGSRVRIIRQLSNSPCVEGQTWGYSGNSVWVSDGCRAIFASDEGNRNRGTAFPGSGNQPGSQAAEITCESIDNQREECTILMRIRVRIARQLSNSPCIEGQTWGYSGNSVWVSEGCRAVFAYDDGNRDRGVVFPGPPDQPGGGPAEITCESIDNKREECAISMRIRVRIARQLSNSPCVEGQTWGYSGNSIWVSDGCRAVFAYDDGNRDRGVAFPLPPDQPDGGITEITCESIDNEREECAIPMGSRIRITRQLSNSPCIEGQTWGYSGNSVWVSEGCRAVFASYGSGSSQSRRPSDQAIRACNDFRNRYGWAVSSTALRNGSWEIILRYDDGEYVCTVDERGDFLSFRKR